MKLKAKSNGTSMFVKFNKIGDSCEGEFVEFNEDVPSKFGDEDNLILKGDGGPLMIRCSTKLKAIIKDNIEHFVRGARVKITFSGEINTGKGNPMKDFEVEVNPPTPAQVAKMAAEDKIAEGDAPF